MTVEFSHPLVSIIIPTYRHGHYIEETLESLAQQNYPITSRVPNLDIVVVDDGNDETDRAITKTLEDKFQNRFARFQVIYTEHKGANAAINRGYKEISPDSEFIAIFDSDDIALPHYVSSLTAALVSARETDPNVVMAHSDDYIVDETGQYVIAIGNAGPFGYSRLMKESHIPGNAIIVKKVFHEIMLLNEEDHRADKHPRYLAIFGDHPERSSVYYPGKTFLYRTHPRQNSQLNQKLKAIGVDFSNKEYPVEDVAAAVITYINIPRINHEQVWDATPHTPTQARL